MDDTEVDLVVRKSGRIHYCQVTASLMEESAFDCEIPPFRNISDNCPKTILTNDSHTFVDHEGVEMIDAVDRLIGRNRKSINSEL